MIDPVILTYKVDSLNISRKDITELITAGKGELPDVFMSYVEDLLTRIKDEDTFCGYVVYDSIHNKGSIKVNGVFFELVPEVDALLQNSEKLAVFILTTGAKLDNILHSFTDTTDQYIADITGTLIIDKLAEKVQAKVKHVFSQYKITNSVSPGNCGWPLEVQFSLFKLLPKDIFDIKLNESGMMTPVKSLTGVIGIGEHVSFKHTECEFCTSKNCMYRKN